MHCSIGGKSGWIVTCDKSQFLVVKDAGLVSDVFDKDRLTYLRGNTGIGHVVTPNGQW